MKCYIVFFSEHRQEAPFVQKVFLSKKEANDYVEFRNWQCHEKYKNYCIERGLEYDENEELEILWVEEKELF
jgi:hypothetical protein